MRIRLIFQHAGESLVEWPKTIREFPKLIRMLNRVYKQMAYEKSDEYMINYEVHFVEQGKGSAFPWESPVDLDVLLNNNSFYGCQCGAKHTSAPDLHMFFCRMYKPRD